MVQAARVELMRNESLVELLAAQTLQGASSGGLLANKQEIDFLLRLAGTTQISRAIKDAGARKGEQFALVAAGRSAVRLPPGLKARELQRRRLSVSELGRIERAALLSAKRA
jgi:tRNA threonylcarbamoyladenosine modification (KEOPS) complex Cgi121 subunit